MKCNCTRVTLYGTCVVESLRVASMGCVLETGVLAVVVVAAAAVVVAGVVELVAGGEDDVAVLQVVAGIRAGTLELLGDIAGGVVDDVMIVGGGSACCGSEAVEHEKPVRK